MLAAAGSRGFIRWVKVTVNGRALDAKNGETVLELCERHGIKIPRLCHHPSLPRRASCRICLVECNGKWLSPACVTTVWDDLSIATNSKPVQTAVRGNLSLLLESHDERCTSCVANAGCTFRDLCVTYGAAASVREPASPGAIDRSTKPIQIDPSKCVLCARCVRACEFVAGQKAIQFTNRAYRSSIEPHGGLELAQTNCITCGQCTLYCPVGAVTEQSVAREVREKLKSVKKAIAQVDPSLFVNFGEAFGLPAGTVITGKIVSALKKLGFSKVYNNAVGFDAFGLEEAAVVLERFSAGIKEPVYSSYCGSWKTFCNKSRPDLIPGITKTPAPAAITASLTADPTAYSVVITSCIGKKNGIPKSDVTITARELAQILRLENINILTLPDTPFDIPFDKGYANAGAGGIADLVLRTVYQKATGKTAKLLTFAPVKGLAGVSAASLDIAGKTIAAAVVEGIVNVPKFVEAVAAGTLPSVAYVEVQACPGGCTVGGGSPKFDAEGVVAARVAAAKALPGSPPLATGALGGIGKAALEAAGLHRAHAFLQGSFAGK